ncbi:MAG: ATP-binding protein [Deltaproteobacteria bacterium]|nr:ATP-binding protein [Deltaproteobacteria bacterium]
MTGGPGAGKTAVLELARRRFCNHVQVLPEVATMLFGGGFPRLASREALESAQRAIASVQREIERTIASDGKTAVALCDRGTVDGLAYWPGAEDDYFNALGSTRAQELCRYAAVIHLRTPSAEHYDQSNPVRLESASAAQQMDVRIAGAWRGHGHVHFVESCPDFLEKAQRALAAIENELPSCCRHQPRSP